MARDIIETWYDIPGYEGLYQLSDRDQVKSLPRQARVRNGGMRMTEERILKLAPVPAGYFFVNLLKDGKQKTFGLHQLKLLTFVGLPPRNNMCLP